MFDASSPNIQDILDSMTNLTISPAHSRLPAKYIPLQIRVNKARQGIIAIMLRVTLEHYYQHSLRINPSCVHTFKGWIRVN